MFRESSIQAHSYFWCAGIVFLVLFLGYIFWYDHKQKIDNFDSWVKIFKEKGLDSNEIKNISHDDTTWYYNRISTCVGYGIPTDICNKSENYCSNGNYYGTEREQAQSVVDALRNGGIHVNCPLIYLGME